MQSTRKPPTSIPFIPSGVNTITPEGMNRTTDQGDEVGGNNERCQKPINRSLQYRCVFLRSLGW